MRLLDNEGGTRFVPFDSGSVPYGVTIKLDDRTYALAFGYNVDGGYYTVDLSTVGPRAELLCNGEILRYGKPLFEAFNDGRFPLPVIVPLCITGEQVDTITADNMGREVKLYLFDRPLPGGEGA